MLAHSLKWSPEWDEIKNYQVLRNHLAHKGLRLTRKDQNYSKLEKYIKQHPELHHRTIRIAGRTKPIKSQELNRAEIEEFKKQLQNSGMFDKKYQMIREGFLGSTEQFNMNDDDIEFKASFCEGAIETIDSFWEQLIESVKKANTSP